MDAIDPRLKLLWFLLYGILIFVIKALPLQFFLMLITAFFILISGRKITVIMTKIKYLLYFLPITFFIHLFFGTDAAVSLFHLNFSAFSLSLFYWPAVYTFRIFNFIFFMAFIISWIEASKAMDGIYLLLAPLKRLKLPVDDFFQILFIAIRFFPLLQEEYKKIDESLLTYSKKGKKENNIVNITNNTISMIILSFQKAEKIALSMHIRGYGRGNRSYYTHLQFHQRDMLFFIFSISFFLIMQYRGYIFEALSI